MKGEMPDTKNEATVALYNLPHPYGTPCIIFFHAPCIIIKGIFLRHKSMSDIA